MNLMKNFSNTMKDMDECTMMGMRIMAGGTVSNLEFCEMLRRRRETY